MKKIVKVFTFLLLICTLFTFIGCNKKQTKIVSPPTFSIATPGDNGLVPTALPTAEVIYPTPEPGIANILSIYVNNSGTRNIVKNEYLSKWKSGATIKCFEALTTDEEKLTCDWFGDLWFDKWNNFTNYANTKIGYYVTITLKTGEILEYDVKTPNDTYNHTQYLETYLYDDYNIPKGSSYSHLEPDDVTDKTVLTSIKFVCGKNIDAVSEMSLTAYLFTTDYPERRIAETSILVKNSNI